MERPGRVLFERILRGQVTHRVIPFRCFCWRASAVVTCVLTHARRPNQFNGRCCAGEQGLGMACMGRGMQGPASAEIMTDADWQAGSAAECNWMSRCYPMLLYATCMTFRSKGLICEDVLDRWNERHSVGKSAPCHLSWRLHNEDTATQDANDETRSLALQRPSRQVCAMYAGSCWER